MDERIQDVPLTRMTQPNSGAPQKLIAEVTMLWVNENMGIVQLDYVHWNPNLLHSNQARPQLQELDQTLTLGVQETKSVNHLLNAPPNIGFPGRQKDVRWVMEELEFVVKILLIIRVRYFLIANKQPIS